MCSLNLFSGMRTAGTWPMRCVCSSYLVGFVMCGGVAKGSGNVEFFQHNHMSPAATLLCLWACVLSQPVLGSFFTTEVAGSVGDRRNTNAIFFNLLILEHISVQWGPLGLG